MAEPAARLARLLREERDALLAGDLDALGALAAEKERLADALGQAAPDAPERLRDLARHAEENGRLLEAARAGLVAAQERIAAIRAGAPLATYDAAGTRRHHGARGSAARRA